MNNLLTRRRFMKRIVSASAGIAVPGAAFVLAKRYGLSPPDDGGLFGVGSTLTYAAHRALLYRQPMAREFRRDQISTNFPAINTTMPNDPSYQEDMKQGFLIEQGDWTATYFDPDDSSARMARRLYFAG